MTQRRIELTLQALEAILSTSRAIGFVLVRGEDKFVKSGRLSKKGFQNVVEALQRHWLGSASRDLNRYKGLYLDNAFYLLYAKFLPQSDHLLGLIYPSQTPLIRIRQDMADCIRAILEDGQGLKAVKRPLEQSLQFILKPYPQPDPGAQVDLNQGKYDSVIDVKDEEAAVKTEWIHPYQQTEVKKGDTKQDLISDGKSVPPMPEESPAIKSRSDLDEISAESPWLRIDEGWPISGTGDQDIEKLLEERALTLSEKPHQWQPLAEVTHQESDLVSIFQEDFELRDAAAGLNAWMTFKDIPEDRSDITLKESDEGDETPIADIQVMRDELTVSNISFYLVPSLDAHNFSGDLTHRLRLWIPAICEKFGWQLDILDVQDNYLKWTLHDFPDVLIDEMLQIIRKETSERIFSFFPNLREGIGGEDFWASGYLVDRQNREFSPQDLLTQISKSRMGES